MAFVEIKDFKQGVDTRRDAISGEAGTLIEALNCHITRGGDVESRKKFDPYFTLPADTFGLHPSNSKLYIFGSVEPPANLPGQIVYQQLEHPDEADMVALLASENFDGRIYTIAEFDDGSVYHYFNGVRVTDWDTFAVTIADDDSVARYFADKIDAALDFAAISSGPVLTITAAVPGEPFTIAEDTTGTGTLVITQIQANLVAVAEVRAEASFEITDGFAEEDNYISVIRAGATDLIEGNVAFVLDNTATALACVVAINSLTEEHGYLASNTGAVVTIKAPVGDGATANGRVLTVTANAFLEVDNIVNFADGVTAIDALAQIEEVTVGGTFDVTNSYTLTLDGLDYIITGLASGVSRVAKTFQTKMYTGVRALAVFSALDDPTAVSSGTGSGFINISSQDEGSQRLTAFGIYQGSLALFTRGTIQIWGMDPDPSNNQFKQLLTNTGTRSPKAVLGYGNSDLMYLSDTGIRSMRARDSSNSAFVDDIGTRIDTHVIEYLAAQTDAAIENAIGITDPTDGRAWIAINERIYVFSYFPGSKVSAWTYYEPGFPVDGMATANNRIWVRSGNQIYLYGGPNNNTYPARGETMVRTRLPYIDAGRIAGGKDITGIDVIARGEWSIQLLLDPNDESLGTAVMKVSKYTTNLGQIAANGDTTHFAPLLYSDRGGLLKFSSVVVHFKGAETN